MNTIKAFFSCRFNTEDKEIVDYFKSLARMNGLEPVLADHPKSIPISEKVLELMKDVDCLVAIVTPSSISDEVTSSWINQEIGMAYALELPVIAFVEQSINDLGMITKITEYVNFERNKLQKVLDKAASFYSSIKSLSTTRGIQQFYDDDDVKKKMEKYADLYDYRLLINFPAKQAIANIVIDKFISDDTKGIMLDSGTVTYAIADALINSGLQIPFVTNNLAILSKLKHLLHYPVTMLPGNLDFRTLGLYGEFTTKTAIKYLKGEMEIPIDISFLAANSIDPNLGFSADSPMFSDFRSAILQYSQKVVLVLQGEKFFKPISNPVISESNWSTLLQRRASESSIWIVCHKPVGFYGKAAENRYSDCIKRFRDKLPNDHIIEVG